MRMLRLAVTLTGSDADGDALSFSVVDGPANGSLSGAAPEPDLHPERQLQWGGQLHLRRQ